MTQLAEVEDRITRALTLTGPCTLELLATRLHAYTWNQVFLAVDLLARRGAITLRPAARFQYQVSLTTTEPNTFPPVSPARTAEGFLKDNCH